MSVRDRAQQWLAERVMAGMTPAQAVAAILDYPGVEIEEQSTRYLFDADRGLQAIDTSSAARRLVIRLPVEET